MNPDRKTQIAQQLKKSRKQKGITQAALSEKSGLSLRSIQRIENAQVEPRAYSLNKLAEALGISFELKKKEPQNRDSSILPVKIIFSMGSILLVILGAMAFLTQSASFPETDFELQLYWFFVILLLCLLQLFIWKRSKGNT